jgi:hypothetical protein
MRAHDSREILQVAGGLFVGLIFYERGPTGKAHCHAFEMPMMPACDTPQRLARMTASQMRGTTLSGLHRASDSSRSEKILS